MHKKKSASQARDRRTQTKDYLQLVRTQGIKEINSAKFPLSTKNNIILIMIQKILITGASGYLGSALYQYLRTTSTIIGTSNANSVNYLIPMDITSPQEVEKICKKYNPSLIIHAAGLIDECEKNPQRAENVNIYGTRVMIEAAKQIGAKFTYISSAAVFDNKSGFFSENDSVSSKSNYGKSKIKAEEIIENAGIDYFIIRPSIIIGNAPHAIEQRTFGKIKEILKNKKIELSTTETTITWNKQIADVIKWKYETQNKEKIFHVACPEITSKKKIAILLAKNLGISRNNIQEETKSTATIPLLNTNLLKKQKGPYITVEKALKKIAEEIKEERKSFKEA